MSGNQAILGAIIAALVATAGYWTTQRAQRNERRASLYAEALDAVHSYRNLPYVIHWRSSSSPETRFLLTRETQDRIRRMLYYGGLLRLQTVPVHCGRR
jgi:hypothetical protein